MLAGMTLFLSHKTLSFIWTNRWFFFKILFINLNRKMFIDVYSYLCILHFRNIGIHVCFVLWEALSLFVSKRDIMIWQLKGEVVTLVDSFAPPDWILRSLIGHSNGQVIKSFSLWYFDQHRNSWATNIRSSWKTNENASQELDYCFLQELLLFFNGDGRVARSLDPFSKLLRCEPRISLIT